MRKRQRPQPPRVLAIANGRTLARIRAALGDRVSMAYCIDLQRLCRDYGDGVASEVMLRLVAASVRPQGRAASRRSR